MGCFLCCLIQIFSFFDLNCVQELFFLERHAYCCVLSFGIPDCFLVEALFTYTNCKWIMSISWGLPKPGNYLDSHNLFTLMRGTRTWPSGDNPSHLPEGIRSAASLPSQIDDTLVGGTSSSSWNSSKETQIKQFGVQTDFAPVDMEKIIVIVLFKGILSRPYPCQMLSDWIVMNRVLKLAVFLPCVSPIFLEVDESYSRRWFQMFFLCPSRPEMIEFDYYFSDGLVQPPTSILWENFGVWMNHSDSNSQFFHHQLTYVNVPMFYCLSKCQMMFYNIRVSSIYTPGCFSWSRYDSHFQGIHPRNVWRSFDSNLFWELSPHLWKKNVSTPLAPQKKSDDECQGGMVQKGETY